MCPPTTPCSRTPVLALIFVVVGILGARAAPGPDDSPRCGHDLDLVIEWTGDGWAITDPGTIHSPFEACRGRTVTWSLGATPPGNREHFLAWVHIAPAFFEPDSTLGASTGFASVSASKPVTLRVRNDAPTENLQYAVLVLNVTALNPGLLKQLDKDLRGRRYGQARQVESFTFVQQDSPPQMIIR